MAKKIFDQKSIERSILADYYHLCEDYWIPEPLQKDNPNDYWGQLINAVEDFHQKYKGNIFAKNLAMALMDTKNQESLEAKEGKV